MAIAQTTKSYLFWQMKIGTIKRLKSMSIGLRTEAFLNHFLSPWFSGYWAFSNPKFKGEEIADALLLWGDVVFIIQIKARESEKTDISWANRKIAEDKARIFDWVRRLKAEKSIILKNRYREIEFPCEKIKWYYGLIILNHYSEPYDANQFIHEGSTDQKLAIQVISLADIFYLLRYINTPWDFVNYFESRYRLSQETSIKVHQESVIFSKNISHMYQEMAHDIGKEEADKWDEFMDITIKAINKDFNAGDPGLRRYASSFLIDSSIGGILYKAPKDRHGNFIIGKKFNSLIRSVEKLTEQNRLIRAFWGERFLKNAEEALSSGNDIFTTGQSQIRDMCYGFIATNKTSEARESMMEEIAKSALIKNNKLEGIFIAASPKNIFATFLMFLGWFSKNKKGILESNMMETMDTTTLFISYTEGLPIVWTRKRLG